MSKKIIALTLITFSTLVGVKSFAEESAPLFEVTLEEPVLLTPPYGLNAVQSKSFERISEQLILDQLLGNPQKDISSQLYNLVSNETKSEESRMLILVALYLEDDLETAHGAIDEVLSGIVKDYRHSESQLAQIGKSKEKNPLDGLFVELQAALLKVFPSSECYGGKLARRLASSNTELKQFINQEIYQAKCGTESSSRRSQHSK